MKKVFVIIIFILLSWVFFSPIEIPCKTSFPLLALALGGINRVPLKIVLAMFFSAIGDLMGEQGMLIFQIVAFAIAHVFLIMQFVSMRHRPIIPFKTRDKILLALLSAIILLIICSIALNVEIGIIKVGIILYAVIIGIMVYMALTQSVLLVSIGAVLFMLSDIILAYNLFKDPVPFAQYCIMLPYYLSQLLIFMGTFDKKKFVHD